MTRAIDDLLEHAADGGRITPDEALLLYTDAPLHGLGQAADAVRRRRYPDNIATYIIDRNINYTNVCVTACKFCAFYRAPGHAEGWTHELDEILRRCGEAVDLGATQIMLQGGHSPELGMEWYETTFAAIKAGYPQLVAALARCVRGRAHQPHVPAAVRRGDHPAQGGRAGLVRRRRGRDPGQAAAHGHRPAQGVGRDLARGDGDRARPRAWSRRPRS